MQKSDLFSLPKTQKAASIVEYVVLLSLIGVISIGGVFSLGTSIDDTFAGVSDEVGSRTLAAAGLGDCINVPVLGGYIDLASGATGVPNTLIINIGPNSLPDLPDVDFGEGPEPNTSFFELPPNVDATFIAQGPLPDLGVPFFGSFGGNSVEAFFTGTPAADVTVTFNFPPSPFIEMTFPNGDQAFLGNANDEVTGAYFNGELHPYFVPPPPIVYDFNQTIVGAGIPATVCILHPSYGNCSNDAIPHMAFMDQEEAELLTAFFTQNPGGITLTTGDMTGYGVDPMGFITPLSWNLPEDIHPCETDEVALRIPSGLGTGTISYSNGVDTLTFQHSLFAPYPQVIC